MGAITNDIERGRLSIILWWIAIWAGVALRLRQWAVQRSIWLDEASLLRNILRRSERGLFKPLDFAQNAPILYLEAVKECSRIFGVSEAALRLPALVCGLLALPLFGLLAWRTLSRWPAVLATFLFAILLPGVTHSAEVKQYSSDECAAILMTLLALEHLRNAERKVWPIALAGVFAIFASHPAVFVLGAVIAVLGIKGLGKRKGARVWLVVAVVWGIAFVLNYLLFLRHGVHDQSLVDVWRSAFFPLPPRSLHDLSWTYNTFADVFQNPVGFRSMSGLAACLSLIGLLAWIRSNAESAFLLIGPVLLALMASALHKYPFQDRLILFIVPACVLLCAKGWAEIAANLSKSAAVIPAVIAGLLILEPGYVAMQTLIHPGELEELRPVLQQVSSQCGKNDLILVGGQTSAAFDYYRNFRDNSVWNAVDAQIVVSDKCPAIPVRPGRKVWLVLSHSTPEELESWRSFLTAEGLVPKRSIHETGAQAILFDALK